MISCRATILCVLALACVSTPADAQTARALELSAAYVYVRDPTVDISFPAGWSAGIAAAVRTWLSVVGECDDSRKTVSTAAGNLGFGVRTVMAGGRVSGKLGPVTEFGDVLVGAVRASGIAFGVSESSTHISAQAGAGIDIPVTRKLAIRGELDYRFFLSGRGVDLGRQFRALTGVVFTVR